ncbi:MAG: glycosyltransferase family 39 protein [Hydrococcus sp. C42_A2020_068]|nr:glycosyltransferase family 39 protein [Hydrococcus sp. C42_A2020_068]
MTLSSIGDRNKTCNRIVRKAWLFLVIVIFLLGLFFRCANLDRKIFWVDEVATATRTAGYTRDEIVERLADRGVIGIEDLQQYQKLSRDRGLGDTLNALMQSPEHTPLYFLMARFWRQLFGSSITATRSLSVAFALLTFPCLFWLCQELFKSPWVKWMAIALFSVSPFYIAYAQEARPYSLWTVMIVLSGVALLRAIRLNTRQSWGFYTVTLIFGFYTSLLSFLVTVGQGFYVIALENFRYTKTVRNHLIALGIALITFVPWAIVIFHHWQLLQDNTTWVRDPVEISFIAAIFVATILLTFGDLPLSNSLEHLKIVKLLIVLVSIVAIALLIYFIFFKSRKNQKAKLLIYGLPISTPLILIFSIVISFNHLPIHSALEPVATVGILIALGLLSLTVFSIFFVVVQAPKPVSLFILTQTLSTPIILILNDVILKDQSSGSPRYLMPFQLGIQLAVAYLLANKIEATHLFKTRQQQIWKAIAVGLISVGIVSGILNLGKSPIYQKSRNFHNLPIATILNEAKNPLLLVDSAQTIDILSLSHNLKEKVKVGILSDSSQFSQFIDSCQEIFLFNPSETLRNRIKDEARIQIEQVYQPKQLIPGETVLSLWSVKRAKNSCFSLVTDLKFM